MFGCKTAQEAVTLLHNSRMRQVEITVAMLLLTVLQCFPPSALVYAALLCQR